MTPYGNARMNPNESSGQIIDAAMHVHSALCPGLLESAYEGCLAFDLASRGLHVQRQLELPVLYRQHRIDVGYRLDLLVSDLVIVEIKAVERFAPNHEAQLLTYLKLADKRVGLLLNVHVLHMRDGIKRMVNQL
jgi:GxxExxY protein